ncbi:MAG: autotransporter domain-containing protein [Rhodanobacteraceae bacterium]
MQSSRKFIGFCLAAGLNLGCLPALAASQSQLVVVHKSGHARAYALRTHALKSTAAVCDSEDVEFAFVVAPADGQVTRRLQRGVDTTAEFNIEVTETCSNIDGSAAIPFDAGGGNAVRGTDYSSAPGVATLTLSREGGGASADATVSVQLLDGATATSERTFNIVRQDGSFQGQTASGSPVVGNVPGSQTAIVAVTIAPGAGITDAANATQGLDLAASEVAQAVDEFCRPGSGGGRDDPGCAATRDAASRINDPNTSPAVRDAATTVLENNLLAVAPDETTALAFNARQLTMNQQTNLSQRLTALHSRSAPGSSLDGLTLVSDGIPLSLGGVADTLQADDDSQTNQKNEEKRTLLGGTRWGVWANGTLGGSTRSRDLGNSGFDDNTWSLTSGVDYRFTNHLFLGAAVGFSRQDSSFDNDQGDLKANATSLHFYGGYTADSGLALDGSLSYTHSNYDLSRAIEFFQLSPDGTTYSSLGRNLARSNPSVRQLDASIGLTYTIIHEAWTFAPQAQYLYLKSDYSAFSERGPSAFNLDYQSMHDNGGSLSAGIYVDRTFATTVGAFRPYSRLLYYADSGGVPDDLFATFQLPNTDGSHTPIRLITSQPDRRYGTVELGMGYSRPIGTRTVDFNIGALELFDSDNLRRWSLRLDARVPF